MPRTHFGRGVYIAETVDFFGDYRGDSSLGMKIAAPRYHAKETSQNETSSCAKREPLGLELRTNCPPTEVVALVCRGLSNKEIARELRLSEGTTKVHVHNILVKTGFRSRTEIMFAATRLTA